VHVLSKESAQPFGKSTEHLAMHNYSSTLRQQKLRNFLSVTLSVTVCLLIFKGLTYTVPTLNTPLVWLDENLMLAAEPSFKRITLNRVAFGPQGVDEERPRVAPRRPIYLTSPQETRRQQLSVFDHNRPDHQESQYGAAFPRRADHIVYGPNPAKYSEFVNRDGRVLDGRIIGFEPSAAVVNTLIDDASRLAGIMTSRNSGTAKNVEDAVMRLASLISTTEEFSFR
jgi:hypothetical protein